MKAGGVNGQMKAERRPRYTETTFARRGKTPKGSACCLHTREERDCWGGKQLSGEKVARGTRFSARGYIRGFMAGMGEERHEKKKGELLVVAGPCSPKTSRMGYLLERKGALRSRARGSFEGGESLIYGEGEETRNHADTGSHANERGRRV